jgi:hypothetical protein
MGLFATNGLAKGEIVWAEPANAGSVISAIPRTRAWIEALPAESKRAYVHFMYKTGEDEYQSLAEFNDVPIEDFPKVRTVDVSNYMNHSCNPSCWFVDGGDKYTGLMVAARDLQPGDEITFDYCTSEDCELSPEWKCLCGAPECRSRITPCDWQQPSLQGKYAGHFLPHIAAKIAHSTGEPPAPLERVDPSSSWWVRQLFLGNSTMPATETALPTDAPAAEPSVDISSTGLPTLDAEGNSAAFDRSMLLARRATGRELDTLNRQSAMLIVQHGLKVCTNDKVGGFVRVGTSIAAGELVMLLPPNLLLWDSQVPDYNTCLQVGATRGGERLFSSSITRADIDNYLCHSCEPNCEFTIGDDFACGLIALREIEAGESINFDYDMTEDDLTGDRGGFECHCGAPTCRKWILGKLHSPPPGGPPPGVVPGNGLPYLAPER